MKVLAFDGSPRRGGNTDTLLERVVLGAREAGADVEQINARDLHLAGCVECGGCERSGTCIVRDDFQEIYPKIELAERLLVATPMFFGHMSSQMKAVVDRCQAFWSRKYVAKIPMPILAQGRQGYLLVVAGQRRIRFECIEFTMRVLMDSLNGEYAGSLTLPGIDARGDALRHPTAIEDAYRFGQRIAQTE